MLSVGVITFCVMPNLLVGMVNWFDDVLVHTFYVFCLGLEMDILVQLSEWATDQRIPRPSDDPLSIR